MSTATTTAQAAAETTSTEPAERSSDRYVVIHYSLQSKDSTLHVLRHTHSSSSASEALVVEQPTSAPVPRQQPPASVAPPESPQFESKRATPDLDSSSAPSESAALQPSVGVLTGAFAKCIATSASAPIVALGTDLGGIAVFSAHEQGTLTLTATKGATTGKKAKDSLWVITFSLDEQFLLAGSLAGMLFVFETRAWALVKSFKAHSKCVSAVAPLRRGNNYLTASEDRTCRIWNRDQDDQLILEYRGHTKPVSACVVLPLPRTAVASADFTKGLRVWDSSTGAEIKTSFSEDTKMISAMVASSRENAFVTGDWVRRIRGWDATSLQVRWCVNLRAELRTLVMSTSESHVLVTAGGIGPSFASVWRVADGTSGQTSVTFPGFVTATSLFPNSGSEATPVQDGAPTPNETPSTATSANRQTDEDALKHKPPRKQARK
eukprot:m.89992 g.89992  ORF g.89992 m.89992 type:complete len:436 (-) comp51073_c0_seq1:2-1309(-)